MKSRYSILSIILIVLICCIVSCTSHNQQATMDRAESLMDLVPDSALQILQEIDKSDLNSKASRARYALLLSMALDKNYIDTTNFNVLQPAIDYYLKKGSPNDKLRTYYYQGRIYDNKGEQDSALNSFVKAIDNIPGSTDSLCAARALVSSAIKFYQLHDIDSYMQNYLHAAKIYNKKGSRAYEFNCLINALNGAILLNQENQADSLINICNKFDSLTNIQNSQLQGRMLTFKTIYGTVSEVKELIKNNESSLKHSVPGLLNLASAYNKIGNSSEALKILKDIRNRGIEYDTLKYLAISVYAYKNI
ncbi:MAG: hypothetical protein HDS83_01145, partial [Bacteroidales bacterium]|nr:hypothetical protein [Bacteroidales bacterium]